MNRSKRVCGSTIYLFSDFWTLASFNSDRCHQKSDKKIRNASETHVGEGNDDEQGKSVLRWREDSINNGECFLQTITALYDFALKIFWTMHMTCAKRLHRT